MRRILLVMAACLFASQLSSTGLAQAGGIDVRFEGLPRIELAFESGPLKAEWTSASQSAAEATYTCQGATLVVRRERRDHGDLLRFRLQSPPGASLAVGVYTAKITMPLADLHAVMVPNQAPIAHTLDYFGEHKKWPENMKLYRCLIPEGFTQAANANHDAPFILLTDRQGNNRIAAGWTMADRSGELKGEAQKDAYVLSFIRRSDVPFTGENLEDTLFVDTKATPWWPVVRTYAKTFDELNGRRHAKAPDWATDPVFCTWYCYGDHIKQEGLLKIARKCKELGFGTILIDAGWDCRPNGGYADFEKGILGDFTAMPDRFPDMPGAIKQVHGMGLHVELWSAPFWQGKKSRAYQEKTRDWHVRTPAGKEDYNLCPRYAGTRAYLKEKFAWVARTYGIDGMWLDAADSVPPRCVAQHEHIAGPMGAAFVDCLAAIHEGLRSVNPQAVTEARVMHANINTKRGLDVVQPSDAPESFDMLRLAGIHIRPWAYDVVVKNDPMFWKKDVDAATVGKFLATMVCNGVPALSVDYLTAAPEQCKLTAAWLTFYKQHKPTLLNGEFSLFGADYGIPDMMIAGEQEAVVYLRNTATREVALPKPVSRVILLNCTDADGLTLRLAPGGKQQRIQMYHLDWTEKGGPVTVEIRGDSPSTYAVPQGAAAMVEIH